jgi:flagellin
MRGIIHDMSGVESAARQHKDYEMSSILTNTSSMVALQTLKGINRGMAKVQDEISTGLKVATAKDNSSAWSIASTMKSDIASYGALSESLASASKMVGAFRKAAEDVAGLLTQIQTKATQAFGADADSLAKLQDEVTALTDSITSIATSTQYNGISLVSAAAADRDILVAIVRDDTGALTAATMTVTAQDLEALGAAITLADDGSNLDAIDTLIDDANTAAAAFGAAQARIEAQSNMLASQMDALKGGVSAMVDADMEEASARLAALQTQQQLGIQALSIANSAPHNVLALFRN